MARKMAKKACECCGEIFEGIKSRVESGRAKYCSSTCRAIVVSRANPREQRGANNPNWRGGPKPNYYYTKKNRDPKKYNAQGKLQYAVRTGNIKRKPCQVCGELKVEGHHPDYDKPLDVIWLCRKHHIAAHKNI